MLQQDKAEDFVIASGITTSVRDFLTKSFKHLGVELEYSGEGINEIAIIKDIKKPNEHIKVGQVIAKVDPRYFRPTEVDLLIGDPTKSKTKLGWKLKYTLDDLIKEMVEEDVLLFQRDKFLKEGGHKVFQYHE